MAESFHRFSILFKDRGPLKERGRGRFDGRYGFEVQADVDTIQQMRDFCEMAIGDFENPPHTRPTAQEGKEK